MTHLTHILSNIHYTHSSHVLSSLQFISHLFAHFKKTFDCIFLHTGDDNETAFQIKLDHEFLQHIINHFSIPFLYTWMFASTTVTSLGTHGYIELSTITYFPIAWFQLLLKNSFIFCFKYFLHCAWPCTCQHQVSSAIVLPKTIFPKPHGIPQTSVFPSTVFKSSAKCDIWNVQLFSTFFKIIVL